MAARPEHSSLTWRKSKASSTSSDCVEVARSERSVLIRDSHNPAAGALTLSFSAWRALLHRIHNGDYRQD